MNNGKTPPGKVTHMRSIATLVATLAIAAAQAAAAQEVPSRVGRLALTEGQVSVYQDPELGWDKAYVNTPITSENSIWTDNRSRAEMRVGGIAVRLDEETQLDVSRLDENDFDAGMPRGTVNLRVRYKQQEDHITFSTPHAMFVIETDGRYRLDVDEDRDQSRLTVFGGYAFLDGPDGRVPVEAGRQVVVGGGRYAFERAREDAFDRWAAARDQQWQDSVARRYVPDDMTGYEELDRYGQWQQDADYGAIWYPTRVTSGWAPYRYGHWSYVRPWGWTWIDDAPWGYAPSHYGRWVEVNNRWGWIPGYAPRQQVTWAPALVGFFGGAGFNISISSGAPVGWYPLAPWERYDPWYRASPTYVTRVNRHVVDRRPRWWRGNGDDWRRMNRDHAYTVVNRDVFVNRRPVQNSTVRVAADVIRMAPRTSNPQVVQQVLPQRNEVVRFREANRGNVAAPRVERQRRDPNAPSSVPAIVVEGQNPVVRPDFRRRGQARVAAPVPAPGVQPQVSAPAPQQQAQPQPQRGGEAQQNPMARRERPGQAPDPRAQQQQQQQEQQQRQQQNEQARRERDQQQQQERAARENAQRQQQEQAAQRAQQEQAQRAQQEQSQRAAREAAAQQERAARENAQRQQQQAQQEQRRQQEAQRAAQEQQRQQQEQAQRAQREAQQQQQRAAQEQQRQQQEQQRAQREAAQQQRQQQEQQRAQQQQQQRAAQEQQRAQREAAQQQRQQQEQRAQPQPQEQRAQPQPQANPNARGDRGRDRDKDKKDKDKD
jgi:hypothetical protein